MYGFSKLIPSSSSAIISGPRLEFHKLILNLSIEYMYQ